jgi:hypothetical protein
MPDPGRRDYGWLRFAGDAAAITAAIRMTSPTMTITNMLPGTVNAVDLQLNTPIG